MSRKDVDFRAQANIENGDLLDVACDLNGAADCLEDIGRTLSLIINGKVESSMIVSLCRLMQSQAESWDNLLGCSQKRLEETIGCKVWSEDE